MRLCALSYTCIEDRNMTRELRIIGRMSVANEASNCDRSIV